MKVVQAYAPTSSHYCKLVERFNEDVESAMSEVKTQYTVLMGDFNAKIGKKQAGDHAVVEYGIASRNARGELLVEFAERNNLRILNTFYRKRPTGKWMWRSPNGETKNEIDLIMCVHPGIVQDVEVLNKIRYSDLRIVRSRIQLDLRKERQKMIRKKPINELALRGKAQEFRVSIPNRYAALTRKQTLALTQ